MRRFRTTAAVVWCAAVVSCALAGCGGGGDCPTLSLDMRSLAAQAARVDLEIYDAAASCAGNDVAADAPTPLVTRTLDGHAATMLQLPAGHYILVMHAFDGAGAFIGSACQAEVFTPGQRACVSVALSTPMIDGDGGIPNLAPDGGASGGDMATAPWVAQTSGVTTTLYQPWSPGGGVAFIAGAAGVILKTTDHGATWTRQTSGTSQDLEAVWGAGAMEVFAVGTRGTLLHTTDGGTTWKSVSLGTSNALYDVWGASATDVYVVGDRGAAFHGSGSSFKSLTVPAGQSFINCVWGAGATDVYMFGAGGLALHGSAAAGFAKQSINTTDDIFYGWGTAQDAWVPSTNAMGTSFTLWHTADHGTTWEPQMTTATALWAVWSSTSGDAFAVGDAIIESTDRGAHWAQVATSPAVLLGIGGDPAGTDVWAVGFNGVILHRAR